MASFEARGVSKKTQDIVNVLVRVEERDGRQEEFRNRRIGRGIQIDSRIIRTIWCEKKGTCSKSLGS